MNLLSLKVAVATIIFIFTSGNAFATLFAEIGDASNAFATAQNAGLDVDSITGAIESSSDLADLFSVDFSQGGTLSVTVTALTGLGFRPYLFLFDATGAGSVADGDAFSTDSLTADVTTSIVAGTFLVGVGDHPIRAVDGEGDFWDPNGIDVSTPPLNFGTLNFLENHNINTPGTYQIDFELSSVPEPATLALFGLGLAGLGLARRKKA